MNKIKINIHFVKVTQYNRKKIVPTSSVVNAAAAVAAAFICYHYSAAHYFGILVAERKVYTV